MSSHEQEIYPTTSLDENCKEFEFRTDGNYYVDLRQTYLALKLKLVRGRGYETYNTKKVKKEHKEEAKAEEQETANEEPVPLVTHINNILHSIFPMLKCTSTINKFTTPMDCMRTNLIFPITSRQPFLISEYQGVLHCEGYDYEKFPDEFMEVLLSEPFFTRKMKMLRDLMAS